MKNFIMFVLGAGVGSLVTWKLIEKKYKKMADEEVASVKETFSKLYSKPEEPVEESTETESETEAEPVTNKTLGSMVNSLGYNNKSTTKEGSEKRDDIYVISPDEFSEFSDYATKSLTYYEDGILVDDDDNIIEDVNNLVGEGSLETFGQYEDDSVFVRNETLKTDFEILADPRRYSDVLLKNADLTVEV